VIGQELQYQVNSKEKNSVTWITGLSVVLVQNTKREGETGIQQIWLT
jgi:hypothetical protein